mgnify:CR=1 FL=1
MLISQTGKRLACKITEDYHSLNYPVKKPLFDELFPHKTHLCVTCGETMVSVGGRYVHHKETHTGYKWCSNECRTIDLKRADAERKRAKRLATKLEVKTCICKQCNEPFHLKRADAKYCCTRCRVAAFRTECNE